MTIFYNFIVTVSLAY